MLARRLEGLRGYLPRPQPPSRTEGPAGGGGLGGEHEGGSGRGSELRVLELGSGTGLVGIAAACVWAAHVTLTDLPDIVPNLARNVDMNAALIERHGGEARTEVLDWADAGHVPERGARYPVIVAADPLYSAEHPRLLVDTLVRWLEWRVESCFVVELPLRDGYDVERAELKTRLGEGGLRMVEEGEDVGVDDWRGRDGEAVEVRCWWSVWKPAMGE